MPFARIDATTHIKSKNPAVNVIWIDFQRQPARNKDFRELLDMQACLVLYIERIKQRFPKSSSDSAAPSMFEKLPSLLGFQPKFYTGGPTRFHLPLLYDLMASKRPRSVVTLG